ncbi:hypothetical protein NP493_1510g00010 [Ridgeia piscesae]|uniref:Uncharacterized protein n=1 Tax=Ridgeia piscesae TaxID=27915 RepID=A0AAD9NBJ6_RIDPI|nr:hypothetical protein NP493_1510g00010 [Ridgeia piscesae]
MRRLPMRLVDRVYKEPELSPLLATPVVLLSLLISSTLCDPGEQCYRWNCPCSGATIRRPAVTTIQKRYQLLSRKAHHTREMTQDLLARVESERFRGNQDHSSLLQYCTDLRDPSCMDAHLEEICSLDGLPVIGAIEESKTALNAKNILLASLAVFVEQARLDEEYHVPDPRHSLQDDIRQLEEEGIYNILCALQVDFSQREILWHANLSRDVMFPECRLLRNPASIDNRNYMVFYTLEKLLRNIADQFRLLAHDQKSQPSNYD